MTFTCPICTETYQPHWRASNGTRLCRTCAEQQVGYCKWADEHPQHLDQHPCSTSSEKPGTPCRYCGDPVPVNGDPCPNCWQALDGMSVADIRVIFTADAAAAPEGALVFDVKPVIE